MKKLKFFLFFLFLFVILLSYFSFSSENKVSIPKNLEKIKEYNNSYAQQFTNFSYLIAFLAGVLAILSPCILPFIPAYFSYTFKEKSKISLMTLYFFLGFTTVFLLLGLIAGFLGQRSLIYLQQEGIARFAGLLLILLGVSTALGFGFSSFLKFKKTSNDPLGVFLFGVFFAAGWTACVGPILAGILTLSALLQEYFKAMLLMFFYALGNFVPLFLLSMFYDSLHLEKYIPKKIFSFKIFKKQFNVPWALFISGLLLASLGLIIFLYQGTGVINQYDLLGTRLLFYDLQRKLLSWNYAKIVALISLLSFVLIYGYYLYRILKEKK